MRSFQPPIFRIAIFADLSAKANREKQSGVLRYLSTHNDIQPLLINPRITGIRKFIETNPRIDGVIDIQSALSPANFDTACRKIPSVRFDTLPSSSPQIYTIGIDNKTVATAAANILMQKGNRNFAFVGTDLPLERIRSEERMTYFSDALRANSHDLHIYISGTQHTDSERDELTDMAYWLQTLPKPCGLFAYADNRAQKVIDACNLSHIRVPDQISIIGVDNDTDICNNTYPTLTSIWPDFEHAGFIGARLLHKTLRSKRMPKKNTQRYGIKCIAERSSTLDLRGGGRLTAQTNEFIRLHFKESIRTTDIARELHVSRRLLDIRFREITGTTVHSTIETLRMREAEQLLLRSDFSIQEIASKCGYNTTMAFRNAFKRKHHCSSIQSFRQKLMSN